MAVAHDAVTVDTGSGTSATHVFNHTPTGTPKGVIVTVCGSAYATAVTYGGVSMTQLPRSPLFPYGDGLSTAERWMDVWFLGASIPTGTQSVSITKHQSQNTDAVCNTLTASTDTELVYVGWLFANGAINPYPRETVYTDGRTCYVALAGISQDDNVLWVTQLSGWTNDHEKDLGTQVATFYRYNTIGTSDVTAGFDGLFSASHILPYSISEVSTTKSYRPFDTECISTAGVYPSMARIRGMESDDVVAASTTTVPSLSRLRTMVQDAVTAVSSAIAVGFLSILGKYDGLPRRGRFLPHRRRTSNRAKTRERRN